MKYTTMAEGAHLEGLAIDGETLWYSDVLGKGGVHRLSNGQTDSWCTGELWIGGVMINNDGKILYSGTGGIKWLDPNNKTSGILIGEANGKALAGVNEMVADQFGGILFGTVDIPAFESNRDPGRSSLYHLNTDRQVTLLYDGLKFTNGLAFSPDYRQLYHNESYVGTMAYDVDAQGRLSKPRKLLEKIDCDGLKVDVLGRIWVSGFASNEIIILGPDGVIVDTFPLPSPASTNLCFGGKDNKDMYITGIDAFTVDDPSEIELVTDRKSTLFKMRSTVAGLTLSRPKFNLGST
jgi:sugar lactone lactonase YvrE